MNIILRFYSVLKQLPQLEDVISVYYFAVKITQVAILLPRISTYVYWTYLEVLRSHFYKIKSLINDMAHSFRDGRLCSPFAGWMTLHSYRSHENGNIVQSSLHICVILNSVYTLWIWELGNLVHWMCQYSLVVYSFFLWFMMFWDLLATENLTPEALGALIICRSWEFKGILDPSECWVMIT